MTISLCRIRMAFQNDRSDANQPAVRMSESIFRCLPTKSASISTN